MQDIWIGVKDAKDEYPSAKNPEVVERIIKASSNEGDLVLDCFCGSGTTPAVAEKLGRRWIASDLGRFAIHTARKRLLDLRDEKGRPVEIKPFVVQNLGKYERQAWQSAEFGEDSRRAALVQERYRDFILKLYRAQPISGYTWLHGVKAGRMVHVGSVDTPVLAGDVKAIAEEFWGARGTAGGTNSVDVLGWDFAFELNDMGRQLVAESGLNVNFKRIPREVLEKKAVDQGDIRFYELAALSLDVRTEPMCRVTAELSDFIISPEDVPEDVRRSVTHWSQWIDYWAVDWDYQGDTFHNQWQSYRTKREPKLELKASHEYDAPGERAILVKVIDLLGNDTTKSVRVEVR